MSENSLDNLERRAKAFVCWLDTLNYPQRLKHLSESGYPHFLYKYRTVESAKDITHVRGIVVESELWLSSANKLNDPFDMAVKFVTQGTGPQKRQTLKEMLKRQRTPSHKIESELRVLLRRTDAENAASALRASKFIIQRTGVCSFAGDPRSILMWSHYASSHQGVCLGFDIARDHKTFWQACPVDYSPQYPIINWVDGIRGQAKTILLRKHKDWQYEKERRIVILDQRNEGLKFQPQALRFIIFGCNAVDNTYTSLRNLLSERALRGYPRIHLYQCRKQPNDYRVRIFSVDL